MRQRVPEPPSEPQGQHEVLPAPSHPVVPWATFLPNRISTPAVDRAQLHPAVTSHAGPQLVPDSAPQRIDRVTASEQPTRQVGVHSAPQPELVQAVPSRQVTPRLGAALIPSEMTLAIEVQINNSGSVTGARIVSASPSTTVSAKQQCLIAARQWLFRPATRGGVALPSTYLIQFVLRPPQ